MRRLDHVKLAGAVDIDPGNVPVAMDGVELGEHRGSHRRIPQDLKGLSSRHSATRTSRARLYAEVTQVALTAAMHRLPWAPSGQP
jgi:hypothetical protein